MTEFEAKLAEYTCDLAEVSPLLRNEAKSKEIQQLIALHAQGRLRRFTLLFVSFIWVADCPPNIDLYETQCKEVKMRWQDWPETIVDVGFHHSWRWTERCMVDYDVNLSEWPESGQKSKAVSA